MKTVAISFSYADNSLQTRGLKLLQEKLDMQIFDMLDFNMPVCNSNKSDGVVPDSVDKFNKVLEDADVLIFAISEATSHYCAGFKNAMDWLVVKSVFNARLGTNYAITNKPVFVVTFSPTTKYPNGARHFNMTTELLEKLGADVKDCLVINDAWNTIIPGNFDAVNSIYKTISLYIENNVLDKQPKDTVVPCDSNLWLDSYHLWDLKWRYEMLPVHKVNGYPWPRISSDKENNLINVPLKENYKLRSMDYLDTEEAKPIFEKQVDIIIDNQIKGIVDVGCRIGIINNLLQERGYSNYNYMGYDTSWQPINYAQEFWKNFDNIEYRVGDMYKTNYVDFDVDCVIWSGVLLYNPTNHMELFEAVTFEQYSAKHAIIQEPCLQQDADKWLPNMRLNTIEQDLEKYAKKYNYEDWIIEAQIFSGRRRIAHIWK